MECGEEFAPIPTNCCNKQHKATAVKKQKHPFTKYYIEAHSGSSVVVDCSGNTNIGKNAEAPTNEMEADLLRLFRLLPLRSRIDLMKHLYQYETENANTKKAK